MPPREQASAYVTAQAQAQQPISVPTLQELLHTSEPDVFKFLQSALVPATRLDERTRNREYLRRWRAEKRRTQKPLRG